MEVGRAYLPFLLFYIFAEIQLSADKVLTETISYDKIQSLPIDRRKT